MNDVSTAENGNCPDCGASEYATITVVEINSNPPDRQCVECGTYYNLPTPDA